MGSRVAKEAIETSPRLISKPNAPHRKPRLDLNYAGEPALKLREQEVVSFRRGTRRILLSSLHPGSHLFRREVVRLPPNGQCALKNLETFPKRETPPHARGNVASRSRSTVGVSAQAKRVTKGSRYCRCSSLAWSFSCIASRQIG